MRGRDVLCVGTIRISDSAGLDALCAFLRAVHVRLDQVHEDGVTASIPGAQTVLHEQRELIGYITTFNALHPGCVAVLDD